MVTSTYVIVYGGKFSSCIVIVSCAFLVQLSRFGCLMHDAMIEKTVSSGPSMNNNGMSAIAIKGTHTMIPIATMTLIVTKNGRRYNITTHPNTVLEYPASITWVYAMQNDWMLLRTYIRRSSIDNGGDCASERSSPRVANAKAFASPYPR